MLTIILLVSGLVVLIMVASVAFSFMYMLVQIGWQLLLGKAIFDGILFILAGLFGMICVWYGTMKSAEWLADKTSEQSLKDAYEHAYKATHKA